MIGREMQAEIVRLHEIEGWRPGTIGRHLGIHHETVKSALVRAGHPIKKKQRRSSKLDRFESLVRDIFERYPKLPSSVAWRMITSRGYTGSESHFRRQVRELSLRPRKQAEAFLELRTLPGEQAQVDWANFGSVAVDGGERKLSAFLMVLSYSRRIFVQFFFDQKMPSFLEGHVRAFGHFGGIARNILYDNLKSAVIERFGDAIRFHPKMLELASWHRFLPKPVAIARGNEKGRVERAISYLRSSFFLPCEWSSLADINRQALDWCTRVSDQRAWPQQRSISVRDAFAKEREFLIGLPSSPFPTADRIQVSIAKTPYAAFDSNRYSVPHDRVRRKLVLEATSTTVRIFDDTTLVASHDRCFDKGKIIEIASHIERLKLMKSKARLHHQQQRLLDVVPAAEKLLCELANRNHSLGVSMDELNRLLDAFGPQEFEIAVHEALNAGSPHPATVRLILDRRRRAEHQRPPVAINLAEDKGIHDLVVKPHNLADYDRVNTSVKEGEDR